MSHPVQKRKHRGRRFRCGRKVGYSNAINAGRDLERLEGRQGVDARLNVYHCGQCKRFHVGREAQERIK